jgi:putative glycerol-1-phosphate prenyltransferase
MIIDGSKQTSVSYMSNTTPIPHDKADIAMCTALAGEMLGLKLIYMDAGSGAINPISAEMINKVKHTIEVPLIVGGGINTPEKAATAAKAGADIIVVGNALEKSTDRLSEFAEAIHNS